MKKQTTLCLVASLIGAAAVFAQTTATTVPVGYITCNIAGIPVGSPLASAETYISPSLVEAIEFAGLTESAATNVLTFSGGVPTTFDGTYVLEITSGASEGWWSTVVSSTATSITLTDDFPAGLGAGVQVSVRKHNTLGNFLGENQPGLVDFTGDPAVPWDEVQTYDPVAGAVAPFAWVTGPNLGDPNYPNGAWLNLGTSLPGNDTVIEPGGAIRVARVASAATSFTMTGTVKTTKTQVDVYPSLNWLGTLLATGATVNGMGLNNSLVPLTEDPNAPYDEVQFLGADQGFTVLAAYDTGTPPGVMSMLDLGTSLDAGDAIFAEGTGAIINRIGSAGSIITFPGTTVAP